MGTGDVVRVDFVAGDTNAPRQTVVDTDASSRANGAHELFIASVASRTGVYSIEVVRPCHACTGAVALFDRLVDTGSIERLVVEVFSVWTFRVVVALDNVRPFATNVDCGGGKV